LIALNSSAIAKVSSRLRNPLAEEQPASSESETTKATARENGLTIDGVLGDEFIFAVFQKLNLKARSVR
jgi:hypothetical protein